MTWTKGHSGNPKGRTPGATTLAAAVREKWPPERIVELASQLAEDPDPHIRARALEWIADRAHGKAVQVIDATLSPGAGPDAELLLSRLSTDALRELVAAHESLALDAVTSVGLERAGGASHAETAGANETHSRPILDAIATSSPATCSPTAEPQTPSPRASDDDAVSEHNDGAS